MALAILSRIVAMAAISAGVAHAQTARRVSDAGRMRIVVFQFGSSPQDSSHRALAATLARLLAQGLAGDSAFRVMSNPRARRDPARPRADAQYAAIGNVTEVGGKLAIDIRLVDVQTVHLLVRETLPLRASDSAAVSAAGARLTAWVHDRLISITR